MGPLSPSILTLCFPPFLDFAKSLRCSPIVPHCLQLLFSRSKSTYSQGSRMRTCMLHPTSHLHWSLLSFDRQSTIDQLSIQNHTKQRRKGKTVKKKKHIRKSIPDGSVFDLRAGCIATSIAISHCIPEKNLGQMQLPLKPHFALLEQQVELLRHPLTVL